MTPKMKYLYLQTKREKSVKMSLTHQTFRYKPFVAPLQAFCSDTTDEL